MKTTLIVKSVLFATSLLAAAAVTAHDRDGDRDRDRGDERSARPLTLAVFGDWPYNQRLLDNANLLIDSINADPRVSRVLHAGDIHSGSMPCTSAGILPAISTANPGWNQGVYFLFQQFEDPFIYTPGDNEWSDCHKSKEGSAGAPLQELASVRSLFFARPGRTLGYNDAAVTSQAQAFDPAYPSDAQFVENFMWQESKVVFATLNVPGSNNDTAPWTGIFSNPSAQAQEVAERSAANIRWLEAAFAQAARAHARAVVLMIQADMWDPEATAPGGGGLDGYTPFVQRLADLSVQFGHPVLLINGDSHLFESDRPLADPTSTTGVIHGTQPVPNLSRITVQGSTNAPAEWLRLTIDTRKRDPFSFENVVYCRDPATSCE